MGFGIINSFSLIFSAWAIQISAASVVCRAVTIASWLGCAFKERFVGLTPGESGLIPGSSFCVISPVVSSGGPGGPGGPEGPETLLSFPGVPGVPGDPGGPCERHSKSKSPLICLQKYIKTN